MRVLSIAVIAGLAGTAAVTTESEAKTYRPDCSPKLLHSANHHRNIVIERHGKRAPGRDIVKWGRIGPNQRPHTVRDCRVIRKYRDQLKQLHTPAPLPGLKIVAVPPAQPPAGVQSPSVDGVYGNGGWAIPEDIVMCESGGDYGAVNPSSGAAGAYQILPSTSAALGCDMSTPAGQDQCAAKVWQVQGRSAWVC